MKKTMKKKSENGAAAIEFVLVLPFLLLLLFGIIEFSILFYNKGMITNASREGARAGIVFRPSVDRLTEDDIKLVVDNYLKTYLITFGDSGGALEVTAVPSDDNGDTIVPNSGDSLTVRVVYDYDFLILPDLKWYGGSKLTGIQQLTATTVMRYE